jgi:dienelactone hydrolase
VGDFDVYSVGQSARRLSIIVIYDIRGFNISQTRVFCDRLAYQYSAHVVMPDFFRGTAAPTDGSLVTWIDGVSDWSKVSVDLINVANWLRNSYSANQIGLVGFCWGGLQVVRACSNLSTIFFTGISIHGSSITVNEVSQLKQPILFIAAGNDPALQPNISNAIEQSNMNISKQCEYKTYSNMRHGFVAAGANYSNPDNVIAIDDVHLTVRNYLDKITSNVALSLSTGLPDTSNMALSLSTGLPDLPNSAEKFRLLTFFPTAFFLSEFFRILRFFPNFSE